MDHVPYSSEAKSLSSDLVMFENSYFHFSCPKHFHETFQIEIIESGLKSIHCKGASFNEIHKGTLVVINPDEIHTGGPSGHTELVCKAFYPDATSFRKIMGESFEEKQKAGKASISFHHVLLEDEEICTALKHLFSLQASDENLLLIEELYHQVMVCLLTRHMSPGFSFEEKFSHYAQAIERGIEYINDNLTEKLLLEDIGRAAFISPFHFLRIFKHYKKITLHQYIMALRIEKAKDLLLHQQYPIAATYSLVGFSDQTHFTKTFKKLTGLTPLQYKKVITN
jgi:AraC-like DNA-binding protein